jgi:CRISPR/Cas system-associated protein Cas10 (large subunit of type III CRISPR-Cas system)
LFLYADGDEVGQHLELLLLDGHLSEAAEFSARATAAIEKVAFAIESRLEGKVIFAGGDEVLAQVSPRNTTSAKLRNIQHAYRAACGRTLSVGIGTTTANAVDALRRAKLQGRNRVACIGS